MSNCLITGYILFQLSNLPPVKQAVESLEGNDVNYQVFDDVRIEPTDDRLVVKLCSICIQLQGN